METIVLDSAGWRSGDVGVASSFRERWLGLKASGVDSLLIETRSVHSFGMAAPFRAVGLSSELVVRECKRVDPNRIVFFRGCHYVLELPLGQEPPPLGASLEVQGD